MNAPVILGLSVVSALAAGAAAGYLIAKHQLTKQYARELEQEVSRTQTFYAMKHKKNEFETPESAAATLGTPLPTPEVEVQVMTEAVKAFTQYGGHTLPTQDEKVNIFSRKVVHEDPSDEDLRNRTEEAPYIISYTEFQVNEEEYEQIQIEWYSADEILVDDKDDVVADPDDLVGDYNLKRFGYLSGDPRQLYVRNDVLRTDFSIVMNDNSYAQVLGLRE